MRAAGVAQACGMLCVAWHGANVPRCVQLQRLASALSFGTGPVGIRRQLAGAVCAAVCEAAPRVKIWALDVLGTRGRVFRGACLCQRWSAAVMCALCSVRLHAGSKVHCVACCVHSRRVKHDKRVSSFVSVRAKVAGEARSGLAGQEGVQRARKSSISHGRGEKLFWRVSPATCWQIWTEIPCYAACIALSYM